MKAYVSYILLATLLCWQCTPPDDSAEVTMPAKPLELNIDFSNLNFNLAIDFSESYQLFDSIASLDSIAQREFFKNNNEMTYEEFTNAYEQVTEAVAHEIKELTFDFSDFELDLNLNLNFISQYGSKLAMLNDTMQISEKLTQLLHDYESEFKAYHTDIDGMLTLLGKHKDTLYLKGFMAFAKNGTTIDSLSFTYNPLPKALNNMTYKHIKNQLPKHHKPNSVTEIAGQLQLLYANPFAITAFTEPDIMFVITEAGNGLSLIGKS